MSQLEAFRENLKDHSKDIRLNLSTVLTPEGAPSLTPKQIATIALACAYSARAKGLAEALRADSAEVIGDAEVEAAKSAATIMAMNIVFYRTLHHSDNAELAKLPARLRMNVIGKPGIDKIDFELACLAVSSIGGCDRCVNSHVAEVLKAGDMKLSGSFGTGTAINFQPTDGGKAAITGDFVLTSSEVNPVIAALHSSDIEITALHNHIARLGRNGVVDAAFTAGLNASVSTLTVQSDDRIVLGGYFTRLSPSDATTSLLRSHVARLLPNGDLDGGFGIDEAGAVMAAAFQSDGSLIIGGSF